MKIIDLLNKIANGEKVPKKIKISNIVYEYRGYMYCTEKANYQDIEDYLFGKGNFNILNEEVEVIEDIPKEDKKIEKLGESYLYNPISGYCTKWAFREKILKNKINEIIDRLNGDSNE